MSKSNSDAITAILTVWKRNHLEEQLQALFQQTVCPDQIWVLHSKYYVDVDAIIRKYKDRIRYMRWDDCPGVFGRFEIVTRIETPFVYIADDDIIPGKQFLERALEACKRMLAIISPHGRLISPDNNRTAYYVGDDYEFQHSFCLKDTEVDYGSNAWFFRKEWIHYFLQFSPMYLGNGEDIHFSATCQLLGHIPTYVPKQVLPVEAGNIKRIYSGDLHALHRLPKFGEERMRVIRRFRDMGWQLQVENQALVLQQESCLPISVVMVADGTSLIMAIHALLRQTWSNFELLLVCPHKRLLPFAEQDKRIRWIETQETLPVYTSLNIGCALATGKYICLSDSHYLSRPDRLEQQYKLMESDSETVASGEMRVADTLFLPSVMVCRSVLHHIKYIDELSGEKAGKKLFHSLLQEGTVILLEDVV